MMMAKLKDTAKKGEFLLNFDYMSCFRSLTHLLACSLMFFAHKKVFSHSTPNV